MKMLSVLSKSDVRGLLSSLLLGLMALPAAAGSVTDANYTISASASGTQLTTTVPGAATFADSSTLASYAGSVVTPAATISGGFLNGGTNPGSGFPSNGNISNWIYALGSGTSDAVTISFNQQEAYFGLLWGSMDATNTISLYNGSTLIASYTGTQIAGDGIGAATYPASASFINFTAASSAADFNKIVLSDPGENFEVDNLATTTPVPLPATLPLLFMGLGALGLVGRRRSSAAADRSTPA